MRRSLAGWLALAGSGVVLAALLGTGALTGAILHVRARAALDSALLAAAHAHTGRQPGWEVEHSDSPVEVWVARGEDRRLPPALLERALDAEGPIWRELDGQRLLLLPAELERDEREEEHLVVVARAPAVTLARSVGPFAAVYAAVAGGAALVSALALGALTRAGLRSVDRAVGEAERVFDLAQGRRLSEDGPVEIRSFLAAINGVLDRLDAAHRAQIRFTDEAAHELRTPLAVMRGELDLALRRPREAASYRETLVSLQEEVDRLGALVDGLLALARLDAGGGLGQEQVAASALAAEAAESEEARLRAAGSTLALEVLADAPVRGSRALLVAALGNLLRNAAVHAPGGEVKLTLDVDGGQVRFTVDDQGPGLAPEAREAAFDRLARGGEARRRDREGLGLGLPLAREVARRHGGGCQLEEAPGGGCRAVLTVAAAPAERAGLV